MYCTAIKYVIFELSPAFVFVDLAKAFFASKISEGWNQKTKPATTQQRTQEQRNEVWLRGFGIMSRKKSCQTGLEFNRP